MANIIRRMKKHLFSRKRLPSEKQKRPLPKDLLKRNEKLKIPKGVVV